MDAMTLDEAIDHGRAWVDAGWTWAQCQAVLFISDDGVTEGWIGPHDTHRLRIDGPVWVGVEIVPDLRNRGTLGHALGQVRDAWGMPLDIEEFYTKFEVTLTDGDDARSFRGGSLASALLSARRAAP